MEQSTFNKQPVVIVFSILAALQVIVAGLGLIDTINKDTVAIITLVVAAIQAAATFYVRGMVTPWTQVVSAISSEGRVVAGPAAHQAPPPPTDPPPAAPPTGSGLG